MGHAPAFWHRSRPAAAAGALRAWGRRARLSSCGFWLIGLCLLSVAGTGCAAKSWREELEEKREGRGDRNSGPAMDHFYMDNPFQKDRPPTYKEFFYKRCEFIRRSPVPSEAEWACSEPTR